MSIKEKHKPSIPSKPYLKLPLHNNFEISEGYIYSQSERKIHGQYFHKAVDYSTSWGQPVYASASGYAVASYHRYTIQNSDKTLKLFKNKPLGNGLGLFVQIYHPEKICGVKNGRITQYGHLSKIANEMKLKTTKTEKVDIIKRIIEKNNRLRNNKKRRKEIEKIIEFHKKLMKKYPWINYKYGYNFSENIEEKESYLYTLKECETLFKQKNKYVTWINQGDLIGYTGTSGLIWGELKYCEEKVKNIKPFKTWDEVHLHFEEAVRDEKTFFKKEQRDPYGIYKSVKHYENVESLKDTLFF